MSLLLPVTSGGGLLGISVIRKRKRKDAPLVTALMNHQPLSNINPQQNAFQQLQAEVTNQLVAIDERYQHLVQTHIDPLLGKTRHAQLQEMLSEEEFALHPDERFANRRLGMGMLSLTLAMGSWVFAPLMPLAILVGFTASSAKYPIAYRQWKETKRLGAIHVFCIYSAYLWFGGYAAVGSIGAILLGLMLKAKAISENQSRNNLVNLFQLQPVKVWIRANSSELEIPFEQIEIGDILVVQAGQIVPVDGTIVDGIATVDQHMLTGEAQPVEKEAGDSVLASTFLISGQIDIRVEKTSTETTAGQIVEILNRSAQDSQPTGMKAIAMADNLALPTLALSAASLPFIGVAGAVSLTGANSTFASYLLGSLAMLNFLNLAARSGILIKDASALEQISGVDTIVFDKTGTLTLEQPHVAQIHALNGMSQADILRYAAAAEARQPHPIARAIVAAAVALDLEYPAVDEAHYEVGYGLKVRLVKENKVITDASVTSSPFHGVSSGSISAPLIRVGSGRFMRMEGIELSEQAEMLANACQAQGHSLIMVAVDDELVGCIELRPTVRPEAKSIIQGLQELNLDLYIISGDQAAPTHKLAQDLGMTGYFANTLPEAKADLVERLQEEGKRVCFIGDGINDAIAMRQAEVSISLRGATSAATDTAQIILMEGNLNQLLHLFELAKEFERNLKRNFQFTAGVSAVAVTGILLAGFTFAATEIFYTVSLVGGLGIAMKPLLDRRKPKDG